MYSLICSNCHSMGTIIPLLIITSIILYYEVLQASVTNRDCARYSFGPLQLQFFVTEWNSHRIRKSKMAEAPGGIPNVLFSFPELSGCLQFYYTVLIIISTGVSDNLCSVDLQNIDHFCELADTLVSQYKLPSSTNFDNSFQLYFNLLECLIG